MTVSEKVAVFMKDTVIVFKEKSHEWLKIRIKHGLKYKFFLPTNDNFKDGFTPCFIKIFSL